MFRKIAIALTLVTAGCAGQTANSDGDDAAAEAALAGGKADAVADATATLAGNWELAGDATQSGDVVYLWVQSGFAWTRCYDSGCDAPVVEDGTFQTSTSSGKKYVAFYQPGPLGDASQHFNAMYQYTLTAKTLKLRKAYSSRWITLDRVTDEDLCLQSGGHYMGACDCGAGWPTVFSRGAGGCWDSPAVSESNCDDTQGTWSDDEMNAAGTFCDCGYGRVLTDSGCVDR